MIQLTQRDSGMFTSFEHEYTVQLFPEQVLVILPLPSDVGVDVIVLMRNLTAELSSHTYVSCENLLLEYIVWKIDLSEIDIGMYELCSNTKSF